MDLKALIKHYVALFVMGFGLFFLIFGIVINKTEPLWGGLTAIGGATLILIGLGLKMYHSRR